MCSWRSACVSPEPCDFVAHCSTAATADVGNIMWFGWNGGWLMSAPSGEKKPKPKHIHQISFGAQLLAISPQGAEHVLKRMEATTPSHFDLWLLDGLESELNQWRWKAAFLCPPIGGYSCLHVSMNLKGERCTTGRHMR